ncbi:hypothetical protein D9M68_889960 [compost metagenome]
MAHRDDVAVADENVGFPEADAPFQHVGGAGGNEDAIAILLELGALMGLAGILDGEVVQTELHLYAGEQFGAGFEQANPHHVAGALGPGAGLVD